MEDRLFKIDNYAKESDSAALKTVIKDTDKSCTVVWVVLEGEGDFHPEVGKDVHIKVGDVIINKAGDCHGVTNNTNKNFKLLGVLTPIPAQYEALD